ncbi:MAG TPA: carbohydrate ABC transporter permease [Candidatus Hydrogenedentes bacterium]|nr:carbohydrate ABC transporter permease [Candidatus Hydrogenedentota bacterium]HIJ73896.1 carbohydrate ABC transporter permease [Candidatus Hydrogenedentota bacterium]
MNRVYGALKHVTLVLLIILTNYPLYFMLQTSLKSNREMREDFWRLPADPIWENYAAAFKSILFDYTQFDWLCFIKTGAPLFNTMFVAFWSVCGVILFASLAAFAFARYDFILKKPLYYVLLSLLMMPIVLIMVPEYVVVKSLGLLATRFGLILPYIAGSQALAVFMCRTFFEQIPKDLFESAEIDGAGMLRMYRHIAAPLSVPVLVVIGLLVCVQAWNDYIWPLVIVGSDEALYTVTIAMTAFQNEYNIEFGRLMAGFAIGSLPLVILILSMLRYFIQGITSGALKG